jgi:phospholipid transport system substrate-binding protein
MNKFFILLITIFSFNQINQTLADDNSEQLVKTYVENIGQKIITIASDKTLNENKKREKIINEIDQVIDSEWIAKFVLGKNYKTLNEIQKQKFIKLYRDFMINTYGPKFKNYNGKEFKVEEVVRQNNFFIAKCEFTPRDSENNILIDFRLRKKDDKFYILDFIAEGISLIETQRSEFNSSIDKEGVDEFLKNLEKKVENLKKNPEKKSEKNSQKK